jgi:hypothetical protein
MRLSRASSATAPVPTAGPIYRELIEQQLAEENTRKASFEQRGITVITSSGVLVSLLFGIGALVTTAKGFSPSDHVRGLLAGAVGAFGAAGLASIVVNLPLTYSDADPDDLERLIQPRWWGRAADPAGRRVAELRLGVLRRARTRNTVKGWTLFAAIILEAVAIGLVAAAVVLILMGWWK